ncbi:MAG: type VI secretion system protein TssA [Terriglobales bacterium]
MPIGNELLNPIPGPNPGGTNLRYDPIYDKIKEARREEEDLPQGDSAYEIKRADWPLVIKLCTDALTNKSKDLQIAVWLAEALLRREGFGSFRQAIDLCRGLIEQFWDNIYPEAEDDDLELRATPLDWLGGRCDDQLKKVPLTKSGLNWYQYKESRSVGYEQDAADSEQKRAARDQAIADGKLTAEDFDKALTSTPKAFYQQRLEDINGCLEAVDALAQVSEARFGSFAPSFSGLRDQLELIRLAANSLLAKKREQEPDEPTAAPAEAAVAEAVAEPGDSWGAPAAAAAAPARAPVRRAALTAEPADKDDAFARVAAVARWLREQDRYSPVPYVMVRALRWAELRANGSDIDANLLEAPPTELRQQIKKLANDGSWDELIGVCEDATAMPCGRGWLDVQRYFCNACEQGGGYDYAKNAVLAELRALLADYPGLPQMTLLDDTPTANAETQAWLQTILPTTAAPAPQEDSWSAPPAQEPEEPSAPAEDRPPDAFELAKQAARSGRTGDAIEILTREAAQERSGRARFQRKIQLAQICMAAGYEAIAYPILEGLAAEMEQRRLEDWEPPETLANALGLLFRCMAKLKEEPEQKAKLYARICRLDPLKALELAK